MKATSILTKFRSPVLLISSGLGCFIIAIGLPFGKDRNASPTVERRNTNDCGAACLYLICKVNGKNISLEYLRSLTNTTVLGTSMYNIKIAAEALGLKTEGCTIPFASLKDHLLKPGGTAILHLRTGHFVAAMAAEETLLVADPAWGVEQLDEGWLAENRWTGAALLLSSKG
jgi:ABC-type bacteriocin/lantibiotic exporter with double-glycine peptidase domain